ncbi:putative collagen-binding domain-containing protein [Reichenbachiella sp. MALMAid0571]|uniref:putative collagen-binding domain-containing protein n=1 Tax=Reichenbachiella sp. MALMAid0571 TaxID=3143939 RepID=UPI0032DF9BF3
MKTKTLVFIYFFLVLELNAQNPIEISSEFPQYWSYKGELVLLLGGSVEDNLFQIPDLEYSLDSLKKIGGNYVRNTMSSRDNGNVWAFYFDSEKELFDLGKWDEEYWNRFEKLLQLTSDRDIIVQIEVWATFDFYRENWDRNPFNPKNNSNYTKERVKLPEQIGSHPTWTENPFFWSVPMLQNNIPVLNYQQRFVDKLLSYSLKYGNVLYCIDNETSVTASWGKFWAEYIQKKAQEQGKHVNITEMWDPWDLDHILHRETFDHPEIYDFVEISQNNHQRGQDHWENGLKQIERLKAIDKLRPLTNVKTYGNDLGQHGGGTQNGIQSFIRSVFFGSAAVRFHRPNSGLGLSKEAQAVISSMRQLSDNIDFFSAVPSNELLSGREENEAYCRAVPEKYYAIYFTNGGEVKLNLEDTKGKVKIQWLDVMKSIWISGASISGGRYTTIKAPSDGHWVMLLNFKH